MSHGTRSHPLRGLLLFIPAAALAAAFVQARAQDEPARVLTYQVPSKEIVDLVDAPATPGVSFGPRRRWMLILTPMGLASIRDLVRPEVRLAGLRIDPRTNAPAPGRRAARALEFRSLSDSTRHRVSPLPPGAAVENVRWSPDGLYVAFTVNDGRTLELWVTETEGSATKRVLRQPLNGMLAPFHWTPDSRALICAIIPEDRPSAPQPSPVPTGPVVRESTGKTASSPPERDLLETSYDEVLFEHTLTSQLMRAEINGRRTRLGDPGIVSTFSVSPDGRYLLVRLIHRPFSHLVPYDRFPVRTEIWDMEGNRVRQVADVPVRDAVPGVPGSVPTGPRAFQWRADAPATLVWVEAQDGGDPRVAAPIRDTLFHLDAPFTGEPAVLTTLPGRYAGIQWASDGLALVHDRNGIARTAESWWVQPGHPDAKPRRILEYSREDAYGDPGRFVTVPDDRGGKILLTGPEGRTLYLFGRGASPDGDRPFVDAFDLGSLSARRLWRCEGDVYETAEILLDDRGERLVTRRESPRDPPQYGIRSLVTGETTSLTAFPDPRPGLAAFTGELIRYQRADGLPLSAMLYRPAGRDSAAGPAPLLLWVRSRTFASTDAAGQVRASPTRYARMDPDSPLVWLTRGYAVLEPVLPVVGTDAAPNDTYVDQIVAGATAAVKAASESGAADPGRVAVGGCGFGALTAVDLLAHTELFRAGIARNGTYNPMLTPFGFPTEERTLWEAPGVYAAMSPFLHADGVKEPLLLIEGEADGGETPFGARALFDALRGLGGSVRLVLLPHEHGRLRARESVLHTAWEMERWLETRVKEAGASPAKDGGPE